MNSTQDILRYAQTHHIRLYANGGQVKIIAPKEVLTDDFLTSTKIHKFEILKVLSQLERWNPEYVQQGYVWCLDCQHFNGVNCNHTDNPFRTITKCPQAPRKCQWYED